MTTGYDLENTVVPTAKPRRVVANATVAFESQVIEVDPNETVRVQVRFSPPKIANPEDQHVIYGGYIQLHFGKEEIHIPYFGSLDRQRDLPIFDTLVKKRWDHRWVRLLNPLFCLQDDSLYIASKLGGRITNEAGKPGVIRDVLSRNPLLIHLRLGSPTSQLRSQLLLANTSEPIGDVPQGESTWLARNDHSEDNNEYLITWHGRFKPYHISPDIRPQRPGGVIVQRVRPGTYRIRFQALKIYGNPAFADDWETWTSPEFEVL